MRPTASRNSHHTQSPVFFVHVFFPIMEKNTGIFLLVHAADNKELGRYLVTKASDWLASMYLRTVIRETEYRCWLEVEK